MRPRLDTAGEQFRTAAVQVVPVEAEVQLPPDGEERGIVDPPRSTHSGAWRDQPSPGRTGGADGRARAGSRTVRVPGQPLSGAALRARGRRAEGVDEGVVGHHLQGTGARLGDGQCAAHPDRGIGEGDPGGVVADEPSGGRVAAVGHGGGHAAVELLMLLGIEEQPYGADRAAREDIGVE